MPDTRFKLIRVRDLLPAKPMWYCERVDDFGIDFTDVQATKFEAIKAGCRKWSDLSEAIQQGRLH